MLRAIGVPGRDLEQDHLLGPRLVALRHQRSHQRRIVLDDARLAPDLDPAAMRIIHDEDVRLGVFRQIALRDELPVAAVIGERQRVLVQHFDKALRAAAMLDVGLPVGVGGREIKAVGLRQERREVVVDLGAPAAVFLDMGVAVARSLAGLDRLHRRGEGDIAGISDGYLTSENPPNASGHKAPFRRSKWAFSEFKQSSGLTLHYCNI